MIDQTQRDYESTWLKSSYRSWPEQMVGLGIYLVLGIGMDLLQRWFTASSNSPWRASYLGTLSSLTLALSMWILWRRISLKRLVPELSLILTNFALMALWSFSFFFLEKSLLGLVSILLASSTVLLTAILFWKKNRWASGILVIPLAWASYLGILAMVICTAGKS